MDKPLLLKFIQTNHPSASLDKIKSIIQKEIERQELEAINGMIKGKDREVLQEIINFNQDEHDLIQDLPKILQVDVENPQLKIPELAKVEPKSKNNQKFIVKL